jgi:hypothetical protein
MEAVKLISDYRGDGSHTPLSPSTNSHTYIYTVTRERITDAHWSLISTAKEAQAYDRKAYEHALLLPKVFKGQSASIPTAGAEGELMLLFQLQGLLDSAEKVKEVAGLEELPVVKEGVGEMGVVKFCVVDREVQRRCRGVDYAAGCATGMI